MSWHIHEIKRKTKTYITLQKNEREGKKINSSYIYLGPINEALKIFADMQIKPLENEKEVSYSGEIILGSIAKSINFSKVLEKYTQDKRIADALNNIIILRTLFPVSKHKLIKIRLEHSILKDSTNLNYFEEVYEFMDILYSNMGDIMNDAITNAVKIYHLDLNQLIIDATRIKIWKDKETDLVRFGYCSKNERKCSPQVNLILGVNNQHVPLFANTYPGNTQDIKMFGDFIDRIITRYQELTSHIKEKFVIFDQGNVNLDNIDYLQELKKKGVYFVSMVKTSSSGKFIKKVDISTLPVIYSKEKTKNVITKISGKILDEEVYKSKSRVLVCYNHDLKELKCKILDRKVSHIKKMVKNGENQTDINMMISKYHLKKALEIVKKDKKIDVEINDTVLEARKKGYGFFVLFTNHEGLSAEKLINIYKSRDIVEQGFRALKSDLEIDPVYHSKDDRIETHTVMVVFGYLLMSLLNVALNKRKINYSFGELKELIRSGNAVEGFYENENLNKELKIWRPIKLGDELEEIFRKLMIKIPGFDVEECIPTEL
jgi:transposase